MRDNKVKKYDLSNAEITPKGKIFMQWLEMTMNDGKEQSLEEIMVEFDEYYNGMFNPTV